MYYAGLIFMLTEDWEKAIRCFKQAEQMFLPAAYQLFSIYELRYGGSKARKQAEKIFEQEKEFEQNTNKFYFAKALPTQELALDTTAISQNIEHIIHYFECSNAIEILALHYRNEQKALNIRFSMPKKAIQFHELFTFSENEEHEIQKVISRYYTAALGKEILKQKQSIKYFLNL